MNDPNQWIEKIKDAFLFRVGSDADNDSTEPTVTTGSIVMGVIMRSALVMLVFLFIREYFPTGLDYGVTIFLIWIFAAFPAYKQWEKYHKRIEDFHESTLCGKCKHFDDGGQLCRIYDEHVSTNYIPCEGASFEPDMTRI